MGEISVRGRKCSWKEVFMEEISVRGKSVHRKISVHGRKYVFVKIGVRGELVLVKNKCSWGKLVLVKKVFVGKKNIFLEPGKQFFFCRVGIKEQREKSIREHGGDPASEAS